MKKITTLFAIIACVLSLNAQNQPTGVFMNLFARDMAQPKGISENGLWACGSAFWSGNENQVGAINASKWNLETGEFNIGNSTNYNNPGDEDTFFHYDRNNGIIAKIANFILMSIKSLIVDSRSNLIALTKAVKMVCWVKSLLWDTQ